MTGVLNHIIRFLQSWCAIRVLVDQLELQMVICIIFRLVEIKLFPMSNYNYAVQRATSGASHLGLFLSLTRDCLGFSRLILQNNCLRQKKHMIHLAWHHCVMHGPQKQFVTSDNAESVYKTMNLFKASRKGCLQINPDWWWFRSKQDLGKYLPLVC